MQHRRQCACVKVLVLISLFSLRIRKDVEKANGIGVRQKVERTGKRSAQNGTRRRQRGETVLRIAAGFLKFYAMDTAEKPEHALLAVFQIPCTRPFPQTKSFESVRMSGRI